jgi:hypothetical protein
MPIAGLAQDNPRKPEKNSHNECYQLSSFTLLCLKPANIPRCQESFVSLSQGQGPSGVPFRPKTQNDSKTTVENQWLMIASSTE